MMNTEYVIASSLSLLALGTVSAVAGLALVYLFKLMMKHSKMSTTQNWREEYHSTRQYYTDPAVEPDLAAQCKAERIASQKARQRRNKNKRRAGKKR